MGIAQVPCRPKSKQQHLSIELNDSRTNKQLNRAAPSPTTTHQFAIDTLKLQLILISWQKSAFINKLSHCWK